MSGYTSDVRLTFWTNVANGGGHQHCRSQQSPATSHVRKRQPATTVDGGRRLQAISDRAYARPFSDKDSPSDMAVRLSQTRRDEVARFVHKLLGLRDVRAGSMLWRNDGAPIDRGVVCNPVPESAATLDWSQVFGNLIAVITSPGRASPSAWRP